MGDAASVSDDIKPFVFCLQAVVQLDLHVVKLHLNAVKQCISAVKAGRQLIERAHGLYYACKVPVRQHE